MSSYPTASISNTALNATISNAADATPKDDHRILVTVIILGIVGAFLIAYIIYITLHVKRREGNGEVLGPFQGTLIQSHDDPAAHITPFGAIGGGYGRPRYKHKPGSDMRIAVRRPDGAWHFTDSRTPFTPSGVADLDVTPSPISSATSLISFNSRFPSTKAQEANNSREPHNFKPSAPPLAYHPELCREHFDDSRSSL
jgi:hypothetical protein